MSELRRTSTSTRRRRGPGQRRRPREGRPRTRRSSSSCNLILLSAIKKGASDIHIEPYEKSFRVRYRIDGVLHEEMQPPLKLKNALSAALKIMAALDIAERRLPQDGRIKLKIGGGKEMDFRVSVLPTLFGEKIVMRLLDKGNLQLDMTKLGFEPEQLGDLQEGARAALRHGARHRPHRLGQDDDALLRPAELNKTERQHHHRRGPGRVQPARHQPGADAATSIGLNFAAALRSFLRQDPDIIMVGEIRDFETAEIAIKAALTGHMVLSTLHTNDAPSTITRLLNMGIEPFLVTASVNLVVAQRLVRKICADCKEPVETPKDELRALGAKDAEIDTATCFKGAGCEKCNNTGYKGRIAVYEVMLFNEPLRGAGAAGRLVGGAQDRGDPAGHADAAHVGHHQDLPGREHGRRGRAYHRRGLIRFWSLRREDRWRQQGHRAGSTFSSCSRR